MITAPALSDFGERVYIRPHGLEDPLKVLMVVIGIGLWAAIIITIVGLFYGLAIGLFLFLGHVALISHLRGSAIKLGPRQMPELFGRVIALARRVGLARDPDVYLLQSGGVLNAFATRFGRADFVVLNADLVKACGDNLDALDFIIGHELGHIHRGHLTLRWLMAPALIIPFWLRPIRGFASSPVIATAIR